MTVEKNILIVLQQGTKSDLAWFDVMFNAFTYLRLSLA